LLTIDFAMLMGVVLHCFHLYLCHTFVSGVWQVGEQEGSVGAMPQQTAEKGKKKHFQKLRAALRRMFKPKSAS